ncbi:hypothetical protein JTY60_02585 [symbiont of Argiope bruennichi]|uniref:hypothetical protein n=1 Tax=symbiont of Argiope bruennichi TaxID=2810479 RepID=UPI003DA6A032
MAFFSRKKNLKFNNLKFKDKEDLKKNKKNNNFFLFLKKCFLSFFKFIKFCSNKIFVFSIQYNLWLRWSVISSFFIGVIVGFGILFSPIGNKLITSNLSNSFNKYFTDSSTLYIDYFDKTNISSNNVDYKTVKDKISKGIDFLLQTKSIYQQKFKWSSDQLTFSDAGTKLSDGFLKHIVSVTGPVDFIQFIDDYSSFLSGSEYITVTDQWGNGFKQLNNQKDTFTPCDPMELLTDAATSSKSDGKVVGWNSFKSLNKNNTDRSIFKNPSSYNSFTLSVSVSDTTLLNSLVKFIYEKEKEPYDPTSNPWGYFNDNNFGTTATKMPGAKDKKTDLRLSHRNYLLFWLGNPLPYTSDGIWSPMSLRGLLHSGIKDFEDNYDLLLKSFSGSNNKLIPNTSLVNVTNPWVSDSTKSAESIAYLYNPRAFQNSLYYGNQREASSFMTDDYNFINNGSYKKYLTQDSFSDTSKFTEKNNSTFGLIGAFSVESFAPYFDYNEKYTNSWKTYSLKQKWNLLNDFDQGSGSYKDFSWQLYDDNDANKNGTPLAKNKFLSPKVKDPFKSFNGGSYDFKIDLSDNEYPTNVNNILPVFFPPENVNLTDFDNTLSNILDSSTQSFLPEINLSTVQGPLILEISQLIYVFLTLSIFIILIFIWLIAKYKWLSIVLFFSFLTFNFVFFLFFFLINWTFQPVVLVIYLVSILIYIIFSIKNIDQVQGIIKGIVYSNALYMDKKIWRTYHKNFYKDIVLLWLTFLCLYLGFKFYYNSFQPIIVIWLFAWFCSAILIFIVCKFIITTIILSKHKDLYYQIYPTIIRKKRKKLIVLKESTKKND